MPRPRSDTRERIVASARTLLRRQGYHATGLAQIIEHSQAPRGSVYFLFPGGKEEVAVAAIADWADTLDAQLREYRDSCRSAAEWVTGLAAHFADGMRDSGFTEGLPATTVTLDCVPDSAALTAVCRSAYERWTDTVAEILVGYGVPAGRSRGLATLLLATIEGAAVLCRARGSTQPLDSVVPYLVELLGS